MGKLKKRACSFYGCLNFTRDDHKFQMFEFPQCGLPGSEEENRLKEWIRRSCNPDLITLAPFKVSQSKKVVCVEHFLDHQFYNEKRNKLHRGQIPQWNVIHGTAEDPCNQEGPVENIQDENVQPQNHGIHGTVEDGGCGKPARRKCSARKSSSAPSTNG